MLAEQRPHSEPVYLVNALESAWNEYDLGALTDLFDDDAVVVLSPGLDQPVGEVPYEGIAAIRDLLSLYVPDGSITTRDLAAEGHTATWVFEQTSGRLHALGLPSTAGQARARVSDGRFQELWLSFSPETEGRLRAARGR